jgi:hypothetical protein
MVHFRLEDIFIFEEVLALLPACRNLGQRLKYIELFSVIFKNARNDSYQTGMTLNNFFIIRYEV